MKTNDFRKLKTILNNNLNYNGKNEKYQINNSKNYNNLYQNFKLNSYQKFLYKRALYGINIYKKEHLETMHFDKIKRIKKVNKRCQKILNLYKQEKVNKKCNLFTKIFYKSNLCKELFGISKINIDENYKNTLSFKELKISKIEIINLLIKEKILPFNFYQIDNKEINIKEICKF